MPTGDTLRRLFESHTQQDELGFRNAALEVVNEERAKNHHLLASDLERLIGVPAKRSRTPYTRSNDPADSSSGLPTDGDRGLPLVSVEHPDFGWQRLVCDATVTSDLKRLVAEHQSRALLATVGLSPTASALFFGPPGCGKSLAARVLAGRLERPLVVVHLDAIVSSYLGETAANLSRVFQFIEAGSWVVLFDEFDAIAKKRDDDQEHGELKRVVNALLQMLDRYRGDSLIVAATNHEHLLDSAIWRRFELIVRFGLPDREAREQLLHNYLRALPYDGRMIASVARETEGASGADLERLAKDAVRAAALHLRTSLRSEDFGTALDRLRVRLTLLPPPAAAE